MTKHKHSKDKLYIVQSEYAAEWGGYKQRKLQLPYKALPFYCCGLTLRPFGSAVCTPEGMVFDPEFLLPYLRRYKRNPVNGNPLQAAELIPLHFHKNAAGEYHCPITFRVFTAHTHIVANKRSGHVYSYEAIDRLCRRPRKWKDLLTGEPFTHSDVVDIQNPADAKSRCISNFFHLQQQDEAEVATAVAEGVAAEKGSFEPSVKKTVFMKKVLAAASSSEVQLLAEHKRVLPRPSPHEEEDQQQQPTAAEPQHEERAAPCSSGTPSDASTNKSSPATHHLYTTHRMAAGFTSTVIEGSSRQEYRRLTEREKMQPIYDHCKKLKKKGYIRMVTTQGFLNMELHADIAPRACDSFLRLCAADYYIDTIFHRCIKNFMIQGGRAELREPSDSLSSSSSSSPSSSSSSSPSLRHCMQSRSGFSDGLPFENECSDALRHQGLGIVSMANSGQRRSNLSEFFITFKSCEHLNNKHTVFARVVGGLEVLRQWEKLETNEKDKPLVPPKILEMKVYTNPFEEAAKEIEEEKQQQLAAEKKKKEDALKPWFNNRSALDESLSHPQRFSNAVGKYLPAHLPSLAAAATSKGKKRPHSNLSSSSSDSAAAAAATSLTWKTSGGAAAAAEGKKGEELEAVKEAIAAAALASSSAAVPGTPESTAAAAGDSAAAASEAFTAAAGEEKMIETTAVSAAIPEDGSEGSNNAAQKKRIAAAALILASTQKGTGASAAAEAAAAAAAKKKTFLASEYMSAPQRVKLPRRTFDFSNW